MQYIGPIGNTQFGFSDGLLSGFRVLTHRKRLQPFKEEIRGPAGFKIGPIAQLTDSPISQRIQKPDGSIYNHTAWRTTQNLGGGVRTLEVVADEIPSEHENGLDHTLSSTLTLSFDLSMPLSWEGDLSGVLLEETADDQMRLVFRKSNNVTIEVKSNRPLSVTFQVAGQEGDVVLTAALPTGNSQVSLAVSSSPYFPILDTVVVCRPKQLREAAVVLSCLHSNQFTPFVIADPPVLSEEEYKSIYTRFQEAHDKSVVNIMGLGRTEILQGDSDQARQVSKDIHDHWKLQDELTPHRSWLKRNRQISHLLSRVGLKRVVLLFAAEDSDFRSFSPELIPTVVPEGHEGELPTFPPENCEIVSLLKDSEPSPQLSHKHVFEYRYSTLSELVDLAWRQLRATPAPLRSIEIAEEDDRAYLTGLYDSLRAQVPLRPRPGLTHEGPANNVRPSVPGEADDEAVLVEFTGDARNLVGVLYAHFRGVKFVLSSAPDLEDVERTLSDFNETQLQAADARRYVAAYSDRLDEIEQLTEREKREVIGAVEPSQSPLTVDYSKGPFLDSIRRFVLGDWAAEKLAEIESIVTKQIPEYVVREVGERSLTVFTLGLPYAFQNRGQSSWSEKAIGHVVNDPDLIVLRELVLSGAPRTVFSLSAIFDPGYFSTSETQDVFRALDAHLTHPIVLDRDVATAGALLRLCDLPALEFLFFNTHGSDNAIILDIPLRNSLVVQWISFAGSPIVFNNSCLSWTGVGREFIRVGARGYVGTLWSVNSKDAATIARNVMSRLTGHRVSVSKSLCDITVPSITKRAYIFVGTCNVFLDDWAEVSERHQREYIESGVYLFARLLTLTAYREKANALALMFHRQLVGFLERLEKVAGPDSKAAFFGRYSELSVLAHESGLLETSSEYDDTVISLCKSHLAKLELSEAERRDFEAGVIESEARIKHRLGDILEAIELLESGSGQDSAESLDKQNLPTLIEMLKETGQVEKAIDVGLKARDYFQKTGDKIGLITVIGQLCQLFKRTMEFERGLEFARNGFTMAVEMGEKHRQPAFKLDECSLLSLQGKFDEAIQTAHEASRLFRINHDGAGDLRCYGVIGQSYLAKGDLETAHTWLVKGYDYARKSNDKVELANFAGDLGMVEVSAENVVKASEHFLEALELFVKMGRYESVPLIIHGMVMPCTQQRNYELFGKILCCQLLILSRLQTMEAGAVVPAIFDGVQTAVQSATKKDVEPISHALALAYQFGVAWASSGEVDLTDHYRFMLDIIVVCAMWLNGDTQEAVAAARKLDLASGGMLDIEDLVSEKPQLLF